jgi:DNA-binding beta-propeller fold protein YncE
MRFWARGLAIDDLAADAIPIRERGFRNGLFVVAPQLAPALERLRTAYPGGHAREHRDPLKRLLFTSYEVDAAALNAAAGPNAPWREPDARFGLRGTRRGQFRDGRGLAVSAAGRVYVADAGNGRLVVFDRDGNPLGELHPPQTATAAFRALAAVAVDRDGRVFALDREARTLTRFGASGTVEWHGTVADVTDPCAVTAAADGTVLVIDAGQRTVVRFSADGQLVARAAAAARFEVPSAVAVASDGSVYVVDAAQGRVHHLSATLEPQSDWSLRGRAPVSSTSIAASPVDGAAYVVHAGAGAVGRYTPDGRFTWAVGEPGGTARLAEPTAVGIDAQGSVYVLDAARNQVVRFDVMRQVSAR